ncbi:hypothetical protein KW783_04240 [Candidatus Parcubacteria bacterium]|nr:hypothetical protein [Candidatus Parcubacteria bacterium]
MKSSSLIESLESRMFLSADAGQLTFGLSYPETGGVVLNVNGSSAGDKIVIDTQGSASRGAMVTIGVGKNQKIFSGITVINVFGNDGDDTIVLSGKNMDAAYLPAFLIGGNGNDGIVIRDFDGGVYAVGSEGNDFITARNAVSKFDPPKSLTSFRGLYGGDGQDTLIGSAGTDYLGGEAGNDIIFGLGNGDDISGGTGTNILNGGDGDDLFTVLPLNGLPYGGSSSFGGNDLIDGGSGDDTVISYYDSNLTPIFGTLGTVNVETNLVLTVG